MKGFCCIMLGISKCGLGHRTREISPGKGRASFLLCHSVEVTRGQMPVAFCCRAGQGWQGWSSSPAAGLYPLACLSPMATPLTGAELTCPWPKSWEQPEHAPDRPILGRKGCSEHRELLCCVQAQAESHRDPCERWWSLEKCCRAFPCWEWGSGRVKAGAGTSATPLPRNQGTALCPCQHTGAELPSPLSHGCVQARRLKWHFIYPFLVFMCPSCIASSIAYKEK